MRCSLLVRCQSDLLGNVPQLRPRWRSSLAAHCAAEDAQRQPVVTLDDVSVSDGLVIEHLARQTGVPATLLPLLLQLPSLEKR